MVSDRRDVAEDSFTIRFRLASGVDGVLQQTAAAWGPYAGITAVAGTRGTVWIDGERAVDRRCRRCAPARRPARPRAPRGPAESDDPRHRFTHLELAPFTRLCEVLRAGVEGHRCPDAVPIPTFADGVAEMRVLDAVRTSAANAGARDGCSRALTRPRVAPVTRECRSGRGACASANGSRRGGPSGRAG